MEKILDSAHTLIGSVAGEICMILVARRGLRRSAMVVWIRKLRAAADELERALKLGD